MEIDIALVTWPNHTARIGYLKRTLDTLDQYLIASRHEIRWYCSAESQQDAACSWHGNELEDLCGDRGIPLSWRDAPANLGGNMNAAMAMGSGEFVFLQQDDWRQLAPLDLSPGADLLASYRDLDIVRYNWPTNPGMQPTFTGDIDGWPLIDVHGPWPYGDDPHLRRRDFMDRWGWYYDGGGHGSASATLMRKLIDLEAKIVTADKPYFHHGGYVSAVVGDIRAGRNRRAERA